MTKTEIRKAKQDFSHFIVNLLDQYKPHDSECYILYGSFINSLSDAIVRWGYIDKEEEENK